METNMILRRHSLALAVALAIATASGCGGTGGQDVGTRTTDDAPAGGVQIRTFHARALDGYLAGATAYVDLNGNGNLDAFEARAVTDSDGFLSYNHRTAVDYCAESSAELAQHCLRGAIAGSEALVRVTGGYDTITGLPFIGTLSLRSDSLARDDGALVTPQTSMQIDAKSTPSTLGASLETDYIDELLSAESVRAQLATFLVRMSTVAAARASAASFDMAEAGAWDAGYLAMAGQLQAAQAPGGTDAFVTVFASTDGLRDLARHVAWTRLHPGATMPADYTLPDEPAMAPTLDFSARLIVLGGELIDAMQAETVTTQELTAALRALALAAERGLADPSDPELVDVFAWIRNQITIPGALGADLVGLGSGDVDLNVLIDPGFDFTPTSQSISASAVIPESAATAFSAVANTAFRGSVRRAAEQGDALVYVAGVTGAHSGPLHLCIRYRDGSGDFDTSSAGDPDGALLVDGRWNLLDDHTLTLNVDVVGGVRSLIIKSVGVSGDELDYRFDYGGDLTEWTGAAPAPVAAGAVPGDQAACRAALIEAFGAFGG
jgi:hypothetical protein